jgi:hypothetical protein
MKLCLHLLDLVEVVLDQWNVLSFVELVNLDLKLGVVCLELIDNRVQYILLSLNFIVLYLQLTLPLLVLLQLEKQSFICLLEHSHV